MSPLSRGVFVSVLAKVICVFFYQTYEQGKKREKERGREGEGERNAARSEFNYDIISSSSLNGFLLQLLVGRGVKRRGGSRVCVFVCVKRTTCVAEGRRV